MNLILPSRDILVRRYLIRLLEGKGNDLDWDGQPINLVEWKNKERRSFQSRKSCLAQRMQKLAPMVWPPSVICLNRKDSGLWNNFDFHNRDQHIHRKDKDFLGIDVDSSNCNHRPFDFQRDFSEGSGNRRKSFVLE